MKILKPTALFAALILCFALCACAGNTTGYDQSFRDGARVPQMSVSAVESVVLRDLRTSSDKTLTPEQVEARRARYPLGFGTPEKVADVIDFFLGESSAWITGQCLVADGGHQLTSRETA